MGTIDEKAQINWVNLKPQIRKHWQKITDDDLKQLNGNKGELVNVLRRRYGYGKAQAEIEIDNWLTHQSPQTKNKVS